MIESGLLILNSPQSFLSLKKFSASFKKPSSEVNKASAEFIAKVRCNASCQVKLVSVQIKLNVFQSFSSGSTLIKGELFSKKFHILLATLFNWGVLNFVVF